MGIEHYAFALFVSAMICLIAVIFRLLFADVRRQKKLLDEKETQLLQLYRTVENIMEEFTDGAAAVTKEIKEHEDRIAKIPQPEAKSMQVKKPAVPQKPEPDEIRPRFMTVNSNVSRIKAAGEVIERAERVIKGDTLTRQRNNGNTEGFQRFFDESAADRGSEATDSDADAKKKRNEMILEMAKQGKTNAQIAKEFSITQNEVKLIIELQSIG